MKGLEIGPDIRKFFINTLFDATFTLLGIVSGLAFVTNSDVRILLLTSVTSSLALGISSGVSVYEAEFLEEEKRLEHLEAAMLKSLEDTRHFRSIRLKALLASFIVFFTPLISCIIAISPFIMTILGLLTLNLAASASIALALITLFTVGAYMSRNNKGNPLIKGARMALFGAGAFLISVWMKSLVGLV
jgi:predicted membrane protein (TIGR00267 family)